MGESDALDVYALSASAYISYILRLKEGVKKLRSLQGEKFSGPYQRLQDELYELKSITEWERIDENPEVIRMKSELLSLVGEKILGVAV